MVLPTIALALIPLGVIARVVRSAALDILPRNSSSPSAPRACGRGMVFAHVVKNAAPQISDRASASSSASCWAAPCWWRTVFSWPGTGYLLNLAIFQRIMPVLQGVILVLATFFVLLNLAVDLVQTLVDPRIARH
jgi:peptide/nickel transport system permease protein